MSASVRGGSHATPANDLKRRALRSEEEQEFVPLTSRVDTPFDYMTVAELRTWAQKLDVVDYGKLRKAELAEAVKAKYEGR